MMHFIAISEQSMRRSTFLKHIFAAVLFQVYYIRFVIRQNLNDFCGTI